MIIRELVGKIRYDVDTRGIDAADKKIDKTTADFGAMKGAAMAAFGALGGYKVAAELSEAIDASLAFGDALGKIQSLIPDNIARVQQYSDAIKQLSLQSGRSMGELAAAAYQVVSTYGDTSEAFAQLSTATKIGIAGNATAEEGIRLLAAVTKAYGDTSAEAQKKVADLGFQAVNLGIIEIPEMTASIGQATPVAAALGVNLEELFAVIASASGVTGSGAEVMTQMSSAMTALLKKTPDMEKAFKKLGARTAADLIASKGLVGGFKALADTTDGTQEGLEKLFGRVEGLKLILQLTGKGAGDFQDKLQSMKSAAGATDTAVRNMTTGFAGAAFAQKQAKARSEQLRVEIGDKFTKAWGDARDQMIDFGVAYFERVSPMFDDWDAGMDRANTATSNLGETLHLLSNLLAGVLNSVDIVANAFDGLTEAMQEASLLGGEVLAKVFGQKQLAHENAIERAQINQATDERIQERRRRIAQRALAASDPEAAAEMSRLARVRTEAQLDAERTRAVHAKYDPQLAAAWHGGNAQAVATVIERMNVELQVPEGTPEEQQEALAKTAGIALGNALKQAHKDVTLKTDKGVVSQWGPPGTNSTFD